MTTDYFESSTFSLVLTWIFTIPVFIGLIVESGNLIFEKYDGLPKAYLVWFVLCILVLSPLRYLILQTILATSYVFQSWSAFLTIFILILYIPIIFGLLYAVGFSLPILINFWLSGLIKSDQITKGKLILSAFLTPLFAYLGTYLFFLILPFAAYTIHWLEPENVIKATNGSPYYYYKFIGSWLMPIKTDNFPSNVNKDTKSKFRNHIAQDYLSDKNRIDFIKYSYPELYEKLPNASYSFIEYFVKSINYANDATKLLNQQKAYAIINNADIEKVLSLNRKALEFGTKCDIEKLNSFYTDLGTHFRDEYLVGLRNLIDGYKDSQSEQIIKAQFLLNKWGEWYTINYKNIKTGNKK
ncbi:MAG TPA: hypothetical protein PKN44_06750 [Bacteroidales bacterium]|nr:hypothetical protein [Bacteroidales bacterium]